MTNEIKTQNGRGAVRGGNVCLLIACLAIAAIPLVGWVIAAPFILVNFILAIVAMSKDRTKDGIMMLLGNFVCPVIAQVAGLAFYGMIAASRLNEPQTPASPVPTEVDIEVSDRNYPPKMPAADVKIDIEASDRNYAKWQKKQLTKKH